MAVIAASLYARAVADDDDPKQTLETASKALKAAQRASRQTAKEVSRAKHAVAEASKNLEPFEHPKIRFRRKHR
jgi:multidrug resistance efflux pump